MNRRELLAAIAGVAIAEPASRLLDGLTSAGPPAQVGSGEVAAVREAGATATAIDLRCGGGIAARVSESGLRWSVGLLDSSMTPATRKRLSSAVAVLANRAAWSAFDNGDDYAARKLETLALKTAREGDDIDLVAHIRRDIADIIARSDPQAAADIISDPPTRVCPRERADLMVTKARLSGKRPEVSHLMYGEVPEWAPFLTDNLIHSVVARMEMEAGRWDDAAERFIVARHGSRDQRRSAQDLVMLAVCRAHQGRTEDARSLVDGMPRVQSTDVDEYLSKLHQLI